MTRDEAIGLAPESARGLFTVGNGFSSFYPGGPCIEGDALLEIQFDDNRIPSDGEWIAAKKDDGSWIWYERRDIEAVKKLEVLGWHWDAEAAEWKEPV